MNTLFFTKIVGASNDFILVDNRTKVKNKWMTKRVLGGLAKRLTNRQNGIGGDGLLLIENADDSKKADFKMRTFNPDGSEAQMCGNGIRCAALYAYQHKIASANMSIETLAGILKAQIKARDRVCVELSQPSQWRDHLVFERDGRSQTGFFVNTGVPHVVLFIQDHRELENADVAGLGKFIRHHSLFAPQGTNVNFVHCVDHHQIQIRTYERGVEGETLACGTGATAAVLVAARQKKVLPPVQVKTRGGEVLTVDFMIQRNQIQKAWLEGPVKIVFTGEIPNV